MATRALLPLLLALLLGGCAPTGLLYTDRVTPFSSQYRSTKIGTRQCMLPDHQVTEPVTGAGIRAEWTTKRLRDEAARAGIGNIYFMDRRTQSYLLNIYRRQTLIVNGE
jgi:hypothetical protein